MVNNMIGKWISYISLSSSILGILVFIYMGYLLFYPFKLSEFKNNKIEISPSKVRIGECLRISYTFDKYTKVMPIIHRKIVNNSIHQLSPLIGTAQPGMNIKVKRLIEIPNYLQPGTYYLEFIFTYELNLFRTEAIILKSDMFEIVK
jgi:hypothetical protein